MTIKILKQGVPPELKVLRGNCDHCKTEIEFNVYDAVRRSDQREGDYLEVKCPICAHKILTQL